MIPHGDSPLLSVPRERRGLRGDPNNRQLSKFYHRTSQRRGAVLARFARFNRRNSRGK